MNKLQRLKFLCLENGEVGGETNACPADIASVGSRFFTDEELTAYLNLNNNDVEKTAYHLLIIKSQSTKTILADMELPEQQGYFLRLAALVRKNAGRAAERDDTP